LGLYAELKERGFIAQTSNDEAVEKLLDGKPITFYNGFDPTADSLTCGHLVPVMGLSFMQRAGHRPIVLVGGGTGIVGDPTDKSEMRKLLSDEDIKRNCDGMKAQLSSFLDFGEGKAIMVNNAEWLLELSYIPFIREYGVHFTVNKMLSADVYKKRYESGLTFFEFNYMIMQAYDFLELYRRHGCVLQAGGNDQWSNILAGADLIRRVEKDAGAECLTFPLLLTSEGKKMGKSQKGAVWLDPARTSPYEFYQYWRNTSDADVFKFMKMFTFLPLEQIKELEGSSQNINNAKEILAFEATSVVHGAVEAEKAKLAAKALFGGGGLEGSVPETALLESELEAGINIILLLEKAGLIKSRSEGRKLVEQGGIKLNGQKVESIDKTVTASDFDKDVAMIQKGKKVFHAIKLAH
jgi:tyrosyl-tRNA synthetase